MAIIPVFHADVSADGGHLLMDHREQVQRRVHLRGLAGKRVEVIVRKIRTQRSLDQNKYLHAVPFTLLAEEWGEDIETAKLLILGECFGWRELNDGHRIPMKPSSSALTTEEASHLIEWIPPWALLNFNVHVPLPERVA